ncbi:MAG: C39 family peptidase [Thermoanaerobaculales bacterium]
MFQAGLRLRAAVALVACLAAFAPTAQSEEPGASSLSSGSLPPRLILVPLCRQATDYTCGVAATQSVLCYYLDCDWRQDKLSRLLKATPADGTNYTAIVRFVQSHGYTAEVHTNMTLQDLQGLLDEGTPVVCLVQAWAGHRVDYATDWDDGHYVVAVGYDADRVFFMDPSTLGNYTFIPVADFLARWHDAASVRAPRLVHFGMVITKPCPHYDRDTVRPME